MMGKSKVGNSDQSANGTMTKPNVEVTRVRKWTVYPSRNKFACDGRCMCAPDYQGFLFCIGIIVVTGGMFFALDCPYLVQKVHWIIPVIGGMLFIFILGTLFQTTLIDPGIVPRATLEEALETDRLHRQENPDQQNQAQNSYQAPRYKEVEIGKRTFKLTYCTTCQIYRPPRSSHCSRCNNCVERFDHHCPMVGNCVGRRNYRYFYLFLLSTFIMCLYVMGCNVTVIVLRSLDVGVGEAFKRSIGSLIEGIICLGSLASVGGLMCYHSYLVAREMTTNEDIKGTFNVKRDKSYVNPYSHGNCFMNCFYVLCSPRQPSLIDRRGFVEEDVSDNQTNGVNVVQHV